MADTFSALVAIVTFCNVGPLSSDNKCDDGAPPKRLEMGILSGDSAPTDPGSFTLWPKLKTLQSLLDYRLDGKAVFVLRPDGSIERDRHFRVDRAGRNFWQAIARTYPAMCEMVKP